MLLPPKLLLLLLFLLLLKTLLVLLTLHICVHDIALGVLIAPVVVGTVTSYPYSSV